MAPSPKKQATTCGRCCGCGQLCRDTDQTAKGGAEAGDLAGLVEKLDYLNDGDPATTDDLGVTGIWLMPVAQSPSYHGYDVVDYRQIEEDYGTNEDFKRLAEEAHRRFDGAHRRAWAEAAAAYPAEMKKAGVVVDSRGQRAGVAEVEWAAGLEVVDLDESDVSELAAADVVEGGEVVGGAAVLGADLQDASGLPRHVEHDPTLVDVIAVGLFDVDVLPGPASGEGGRCVPVIGRGDDDGIDVVEDARLIRITRENLETLRRRYPRIAARVFSNLNEILSTRLVHATERLR